jgi:predicted histidine transporter YuiF (NhaC family)
MAHNPQALVNPQAQAQLKDLLTRPGVGSTVFDQVMQSLHQALSSAITQAFFIGFLILLVGLVMAIFLKGKQTREASAQLTESEIDTKSGAELEENQ